MIYFHTGSQASQLVAILSVAGEYPTRSLRLLGNERVIKSLVHKLSTTVQTVRNPQTQAEITCRLLSISGKGSAKTLRLYKSALPILDWIGGKDFYLKTYWNHQFPGDAAHKERNHRVAEATAMCLRAGFEFRPYRLPRLQNDAILQLLPDAPIFYPAKSIKQVGELEMSKTIFTRMVGAMFASGSAYAVYNTRNAVMKWSGMGEFKALHNLIEIARLNAGISIVNSAIVFGESDNVALATLLESDRSRRPELRFDAIYRHVHFVPMSEAGVRQLRILAVPYWQEKLLSALFHPEERSYDRGQFEYDALVNGTYVLSHLDGDIARLIRFREAISKSSARCEALCYPHQVEFLREYLGEGVGIKTIDQEALELSMGIGKEDSS